VEEEPVMSLAQKIAVGVPAMIVVDTQQILLPVFKKDFKLRRLWN
jgi:hypothetical protein